MANLSKLINKFWEIEEINAKSSFSSEESLCEEHYKKGTTRDHTGRYIVRLPFRHENRDFGDSRSQALRRFYSLQRKLNSDPSLKAEYTKVMEEYVELGHMSLQVDNTTDGFYMPHHAVIKASSNTTKVRVVFDASAKSSKGFSLNDTLMVGPTIQNKVLGHLLRFRTHTYVATADIEKMYRQVFIHPSDRRFQQIFWYQGSDIVTYQLNMVTFGVASAPFLAIRTIHQLADDERVEFPHTAEILKRDMYVDDFLTGANSLQEIIQIRDEVIELLKRGGFNIRQWASNHHHVLDNIKDRFLDLDRAVEPNPIIKTLGVIWDSQRDKYSFTVKSMNCPEKITKRNVLSEIAKIFDPLGLLGPTVMYAKIILQKCWIAAVNWDESLPQDLHANWSSFSNQLALIRDVSVDRHMLLKNPKIIEIHGFCDASRDGYGACLYIRSIDERDNVLTILACAKSRVAPLKKPRASKKESPITERDQDNHTIPRLELCGALILTRLFKETRSALSFKIDRIIFWSDSSIVLNWLKKPPEILRVFEANRIAEIQTLNNIEWRHVRSKENPADALSRGQPPKEFLQNKLWFEGPTWLKGPEKNWPVGIDKGITESVGFRKNMCFVSRPSSCDLFTRFSSYSRLIRVIAYCLRLHPFNQYKDEEINVAEKFETEIKVLRIIQREQFSKDIDRITN